MPKLRFDPVTYQFYYRCGPQDGATPEAAGFGWDPVRRRYFTEDPNVAASLESHGDFYARLLLADVLGGVTRSPHLQRARGSSELRVAQTKGTAISSDGLCVETVPLRSPVSRATEFGPLYSRRFSPEHRSQPQVRTRREVEP